MSQLQYNPFHQHESHQISFSFEKKESQRKDQKRTIDEYLRLKTNESVDDKHHIYIKGQDLNSKPQGKRSMSIRKSLKTQEGQSSQNDHQMHLMQEQFNLRIQSLTRQYELKLAKQEEFFQLRELKLNQEKENLGYQIFNLQNDLKKLKNTNKQQFSSCSICSNGQVINHLSKVVQQLQQNHKDCLQNKKQVIKKYSQSNNKYTVLEEEHQKLYEQCKAYNKQIRKLNNQNIKLKDQRDQILQRQNDKSKQYQQMLQKYSRKVSQLTKEIQLAQDQSRREPLCSNSIAQSTESVLTSIQNSMKSSYFNQRESSLKNRNAVSKILIQQPDSNKYDIENRQNHRKMSLNYKQKDTNKTKNKMMDSFQKIDSLKWKYF